MLTDERARYLLGLCNGDYIVADNMVSSLPSDSMGRDITIILEERIYASSQHKWFGSQRLSNLLETGIDAANRCIDIDHRDGGKKSGDSQEQLSDAVKALNLIASYLAAEDCFHEVLWSDWRLRKVEDEWHLIPSDLSAEKAWEACYRRFSDIQAQTMSYVQHFWRTNAQLRQNWLLQTGGTPTFSLAQHGSVISVKYAGRAEPSRLPLNFFLEATVHEFYYQPLIREPLSALNSCCLLDALKVFTLLGEISMQVMEGISDKSAIYSIEETTKFCPILLASPLASAISEATDLKKKDVLRILKILTWRQRKSLWFHPLIELETPKGTGYAFAALPLADPNIYWIVDYWLANYGVAMEQRVVC
jgi:hypothetical protein